MAGTNGPLHFNLDTTTIMAHSTGAIVGTLSADQTVTEWNISDDRFMVENGVLKLKSGIEIDDELHSIGITITGVDEDGYLSAQSFDMTVVDPNTQSDQQNIFGDVDLDDGEVDEMEEGELDDEEDESEERNDEDADQGGQAIGDIEIIETDLVASGEDDTETNSTDDGSGANFEPKVGDGVETFENNFDTNNIGDNDGALSNGDEDPIMGMDMKDHELGNLSEDTFILDGSKSADSFNIEAVGTGGEGGDLMFDILDEEDDDLNQSEMSEMGEEETGDDVEMEFEELDI